MQAITHDGEIHITTFASRTVKTGKRKTLLWSEFLPLLLRTTVTNETMQEYSRLRKDEQDRIKDVGAYVGGWLKEGRRKTGCVEHRTLLTLDADFAHQILRGIALGLFFGQLRGYSRTLAMWVSILFYTLSHVWRYALEVGDILYLLPLALLSLPMSVALTWCYDNGGSLWSCVALHAGFNGFLLFTAL